MRLARGKPVDLSRLSAHVQTIANGTDAVDVAVISRALAHYACIGDLVGAVRATAGAVQVDVSFT